MSKTNEEIGNNHIDYTEGKEAFEIQKFLEANKRIPEYPKDKAWYYELATRRSEVQGLGLPPSLAIDLDKADIPSKIVENIDGNVANVIRDRKAGPEGRFLNLLIKRMKVSEETAHQIVELIKADKSFATFKWHLFHGDDD